MSSARTASPRTARAINDRIALDLLAERGPLTAGQLREITGLSRPSVGDLLDRLARRGLVAVVGEAGEDRRGPNARLYGLVADRAHVAALDVRTHGVTLALADLTGHTVAERALPAAPDPAARADSADPADPADIVRRTLTALADARRRAGVRRLHRVAMGAPGLADSATGALRGTGDLPAWHAALLAALRDDLPGTPVTVENEVNLAAVAEHRLGAVRDRGTFVLLWLGNGIGAAVVLDGALRRGASGGAGEIGFLPVPGTDGGFHALAGAAAVTDLARAHGLRPEGESAAAAEALVRRAAHAVGDATQAAFLTALAERVALGTAAVASVLDPGLVVLGGEVGRAGGAVLARLVQRRTAELSPLATEVRPATVTGSPVLAGALLAALETTRQELFGPDPAPL